MGQDTGCHIGVFVQFDFTWKEFRRLLNAGMDLFYIGTIDDSWGDEAMNFGSEEELLGVMEFYKKDFKIPKDDGDETAEGPVTYCLIRCAEGDARKILHRKNPMLFKYDGKRSVDDVVKNFTEAKQKFRDLGYPEESILVGYDFYDSW